MKRTNLDIVQTVLSSMDGDEVNSVSDTTESRQVLALVQTVYFDIAALGELPRDDAPFQLEPSVDATKPVTMYLPDDVSDIRWIKYDCQTAEEPTVVYREVYPLPLWDFISMVTNLDPGETDVDTYTHVIGDDTFTFYCKNDNPPKYYTTTDDNALLFDSYDNLVDNTLQKSKTLCFGQKTFAWQPTDTFVVPLDEKQHQRLLHEVKSLAFAELKQSQHVKAEKSAREIKINQQSSKTKIPTQTAYQQITGMGRLTTHGREKPTGRYK